MLPIELEYVLGDDRTAYETLLAALPTGDSNLKRGIVVPSHTKKTPQTFRVKNLEPNIAYAVDIQGEWENAPLPRVYFSPTGKDQLITLQLPYGPSTIIIKSKRQEKRFYVSVTYYGTIFRTFAREITEHSVQPLSLIDSSITDSFAYRLALPILAGVSQLIPSDLEALGVLSHKLLVKNLLHRPGTNGAAREVLAAFSASNPIFHKMANTNALDAPLYRSEETFAGYEAHVWLPNREVERWKAFTLLVANLPQFYKMKEVTEGEVFFFQAGKLRRHLFDFDSPFANSVLEATGTKDCFMSLFKVGIAVESDHYLEFCQASYPFDSQIVSPGLSSADVDPLQVTNWTGFSLTGRMEQQFGESCGVHRWVYESPLIGEVNGINRFYRLTSKPKTTRSVKLWIDGLLQRLGEDYRLSLGSTNRSGSYEIQPLSGVTQYVTIETGEPRAFVGPCFTSLEVRGGADLQMVLTVAEQTVTTVKVIVSDPPGGTGKPIQDVNINYVAPALLSSAYPGANQYGTEDLSVGISSYYLRFEGTAASPNYKLLVQVAVDPLPVGGESAVSQVVAMVRLHNLDGALVEFSEPISDLNTRLHWWMIEDDEGVGLERGTIGLASGQNMARVDFSNGPYFDRVVLVYQLWHTSLDANVPMVLVSHKAVGPGGAYVQFSHTLPDDNYRLDWVLFAAESGAFLEVYEAPGTGQLLEVQYDEIWPYWGQGALSPPADGAQREFVLPYPCANEKSVYLAMNGRLSTYGHENQYTIDMANNKAIFNEAPAPGHLLWAVMPLVDPETNVLPSAWDQNFAFSRADYAGAYASGRLERLKDTLPLNLKTYVGDRIYYATAPARGSITILGRISPLTKIKFEQLGVDLIGVQNPLDIRNFSPGNVSVEADTITVESHGLANGRVLTLDVSVGLGSLPLGLNVGVTYYVINATANTFQLSPIRDGIPVNILTQGVGIFQLQSPNENYFTVNISASNDAIGLAATINAHSVLSTVYLAEYRGTTVTLKAKDLGGGGKNQTISLEGPPGSTGEVTGIQVTSITGDSSIPSFESKTFASGTVLSMSSSNISNSRIYFEAENPRFFETLAVSFSRVKDIDLPQGLVEGQIYYVKEVEKTLGGFSFRISSTLESSSYLTIGTPTGYFQMVIHQVDNESKRFFSEDHKFCDLERVRIISVDGGDIPSGLSGSKLYYIRNLSLTKRPITYNSLTDMIALEAHGFKPWDKVLFYDIDGTQIKENTTYFVSPIGITEDSFRISNEPYNDPINFSEDGSGKVGFSNSFQLSNTITGDVVDFGPVPEIVSLSESSLVNGIFTLPNHGLNDGRRFTFEPVDNSLLPSGVFAGDIYSIINATANTFQIAKEGAVVTPTDSGSGSFYLRGFSRIKVESAAQFVASVGTGDIQRLCDVMKRDPELAKNYWIDCADNATIAIRAKNIGTAFNARVTAKVISSINGSELNTEFIKTQNIRGGLDPLRNQSFATGKMFYTNEGSVVALDGVTTRLYTPYSGNEIKFTHRPIPKQEPYYIAEVFPIEAHPLDSMMANEPCSYHRGVFTQGLFTQLMTYDLNHTPESLLAVSSTNLPVQEEPFGVCDGINQTFTLNFVSAAGQNSLMLFVDGVFQPSDTYSYTTNTTGQSVLTLSTPPVSDQRLWAWYISIDTMSFSSSGVDVDTNTFTVPSHSLYNGQVVSFTAAGGNLPAPLQPSLPYYVINSTLNTFQISLTRNGTSAINITTTGVGAFRINPSDNLLYEKVEALVGTANGTNQIFDLQNGPVEDRPSLVLFLEGLYQLQGEDYLVNVGNSSLSYLGTKAPQTGQSLWGHYHQLAQDRWRQIDLATGDGLTREYSIPTLLESERPTSAASVMIFLNGLCQRQGVDFDIGLDALGYPDGTVTFRNAPEENRKIHVAYIKRG